MKRGVEYENHVAKGIPEGWRLKPNHPTFDFYDKVSGKAVSVKSLDTQTAPRLADPTQIYKSIRQNVNKARDYAGGERAVFTKNQILSRELHIGVPVQTNKTQWQHIQRAIQYGKDNGVAIIIEAVK
jgi:filamentous hemagglutinin